jgi:AraC-like DNA-binding protein
MSNTGLFKRSPIYNGGAIFDRTEENPFQLDLHKHDDNGEILLVEEGEGVFEIDREVFTASAGTLLVYQRGIWHKENSTKYPFKATYVSFREMEVNRLPVDHFFQAGCAPVVQLNNKLPLFRKLMRDCIGEAQRQGPEWETVASHTLGILFAQLARLVHYEETESSRKRSSAKEGVWLAKRIMEENYGSPITLESLAKATYINKYHLAHLFKQETGISPIQFLSYCRMEAAKRYLTSTSFQAKRIAELVGYENEPSFFNAFKKATGLTPREYRNVKR